MSYKKRFLTYLLIFFTIFLLFLAFFSSTSFGENENPRFLDFIYIEPNTKGSSGGHSAIRLGEDVYHFQHFPSGFFLLVHDKWRSFKKAYNDLDNRALYINRVDIPDFYYKSLKGFFRKRFLIQEQHLANLASLKKELDFFTLYPSDGNEWPFKGAGLFDEQGKQDLVKFHLNERSELQQAMLQTFSVLKSLDPQVFSYSEGNISFSDSRMPYIINSFSEKYLGYLHKYYALKFILDRRAVDRDVIFLNLADKGMSCFRLSSTALPVLKKYLKQLKLTVMGLAKSNRSDCGWAIMVAYARMQALALSLKEGKMFFLDPFSDKADFVTDRAGSDMDVIKIIYKRQLRSFKDLLRSVFKSGEIDELSYNSLENSAAHLWETRSYMLNIRNVVRIQNNVMVPEKKQFLPLRLPDIPGTKLFLMRKKAEKIWLNYRDRLKDEYGYSLVSQNCVTQLLLTVYRAFKDKKEVEDVLGRYIEPYSGLMFVPSFFDLEIFSSFNVSQRIELPSLRSRVMKKEYQSVDTPFLVYLRESNTLTSSLYSKYGEEKGFLLFSDDIFWLRPFYGALNLGYSAIYTGAGIFKLPFDSGDMVLEGLTGFTFSVPEIFFINIRKGSFSVIVDEWSDL